MWKWLKRRNAPPPELDSRALKGAPVHARTKTYSAETGLVYQYVYRGYRPLPDGAGTEFVFETSRDRKQKFSIAVHLLDSMLSECTALLGRELIGSERYALVKMTLFSAFDEVTELAQFNKPLIPTSADAERQLRVLGRI